MNAAWPLACVGMLLAAFWAIAWERARAYRTPISALRSSSLLCGSLAAALSACEGARGRGDFSALVLIACGAVCAISDLQTGYVFDNVLAAALLLLIPAALLTDRIAAAVSGGLICGSLLLLPYVASRGRGIGLGDVKLAALIGFALGPTGAVTAVCCAGVCGGGAAALLLFARKVTRRSTLSFAPFLAIGATFVLALRPA